MTTHRKFMQSILLLLFLVVVVPLAIYGVYAQYQAATRLAPEIQRTLIEPYASAIKAGDYTTAYSRHTSAAFKAAHSLDQYVAAQQANIKEFGALLELIPRQTEPFQSAGNLFSGRRYLQGGLLWRGQKGEAWAHWEVVQEEGTYRIDASAEAFHEHLSPRIF